MFILKDYEGKNNKELTVKMNDLVEVFEQTPNSNGFVRARPLNNLGTFDMPSTGLIPYDYLTVIF